MENNMTRKEISGVRDLTFSQWIKDNLPDSNAGYYVSDIDFVLYDTVTTRCMLVESKQYGKTMASWQRLLYDRLSSWLIRGKDKGWEFYGYHVVTFENTNFDDGKVKFDGKEVTEQELIDYLSMEW
jgi:hypothetical protein